MSDQLRMPTDAERLAISGAIAQLSFNGDRGQWALVRAGLSDIVYTDYVSLLGGEPQRQPADQVIAGYRDLLPGFDAVQHLIVTMNVSMLTAVEAEAISYVRATHRLGDVLWIVGGEYRHRMVFEKERWLASSIRFALAYEEGDRGIVGQAAERATAR